MIMAQHIEKISELEYRVIEKGFYEVLGSTDEDKIAIEGKVCGGILKELMKKTKQDGGKIIRFRGKKSLIRIESHQTVKKLYKEIGQLNNKISSIQDILKKD